jgi:methylglutaconyl-CoA hydratase
MPRYQTLLVEYSYEQKIATVTMNRPNVHNALNQQMLRELYVAFDTLSTDEKLVAVVLTGAGKSFSAGADMHMMQEAARYTEEQNQRDAGQMANTFELLNNFPAPIVARVQGAALGGGLGLMAVSDIVIAIDSARLAFSEVKLGIAPAVISPYILRKIGESQARRLFITGERFNASLAHKLGLIHTVASSQEELDAQVEGTLQELLSGAPHALRACKTLAKNVGDMDAHAARDLTTRTIARLRVSVEGQEGLQAFLEKRKPNWITETGPETEHV